MNTFDLKCYEKTYNDSRYWEGVTLESDTQRHEAWVECRCLGDRFHDELITRGYLIRKSTDKS